MSGHQPTHEFENPTVRWIDSRLPIFGLMKAQAMDFPTPKNLNYFWTFGAILMMMLVVQIITGVVLAMHYTPHVDYAFESVEMIMRDVNYGWLIRYMHANGASMFFIAVYIHLARGLYYGSYKAPREVLWWIGVVILILMMAIAFMGYVLPWGQMSFWGATVITNLFSAIPLVGGPIVEWLWGGFAVGNPTLNRFFSLHYLLPFVLAGLVFLHIWALHVPGNNNPTGVSVKTPKDVVPFHPYYTVKDGFAMVCFILFFCFLHLLRAELSRPQRQLHPGEPAGDAAAHRAGMVPAAVLRDPALDPLQARRRDRDVRRAGGPVLPAVARHLEGPLGRLPPGLQGVLLDLRAGLRRSRLGRLAAAGGLGGHHRPHPDDLLLRALPHHSAAARHLRDAAAAAEFDLGRRAQGPRRKRHRARRGGVGTREEGVTLGGFMTASKTGLRALALAAALTVTAGIAHTAQAAEGAVEPKDIEYSFEGPFGLFDRAQLQRGYKVYAEVCSACHSLDYLSFRNLGEEGGPGFSADQVDALAANFVRQVQDGPDENGDMFERPAKASDRFPPPFPNEAAARAANGGALPPDLSVIAKAREGGPAYINSVLTGYEEAPADVTLRPGQYYNVYFPGHAIGMPPPLSDGAVTYDDGSPETLEQYARDVSAFLMWTAEPKLEARRRMGFEVMVFLVIFAGLMYFTYKKLWRDVEH